MGIRYKRLLEEAGLRPRPVQSIAVDDLSRQQLIDILMEDTLEPATKIKAVMHDILLHGRPGYIHMLDSELRSLVRNLDTLPGEPTVEEKLLPIEK